MSQVGAKRNIFHRIDWVAIACYLALVFIGMVAIYASIHASGPESIFDPSCRSGRQFIWIGISVVVAYLILFVIDSRLWEVVSMPFYILVLGLLVAVLFFGATVNGSKSWFHLGPVAFQPAEISKISTTMMLALVLRNINPKSVSSRDVLMVLAVIGLPALTILMANETGSMLVYAGFIFALYREGLSGWWLVLIFAVIVLVIVAIASPAAWVPYCLLAAMILSYTVYSLLSWAKRAKKAKKRLRTQVILLSLLGALLVWGTDFAFNHILHGYQKERIEVLLGLKTDLKGAGYNVNQSMIAIGSGGLTGKGYLQGTQTAYGFVPEQSTDFIFCTIGEEFGFIGCAVVILLFVFLILRIIHDAEECRAPFNRVYGYCLASCLFMHLIINIGMTIGLMPVIGIPLPFISYGGSSLLAFTLMLFIFLSLVAGEKKYF